MYKDSKRTCTTIVLLIKPFVWRRSRCRRRRGLLKLPIVLFSPPVRTSFASLLELRVTESF